MRAYYMAQCARGCALDVIARQQVDALAIARFIRGSTFSTHCLPIGLRIACKYHFDTIRDIDGVVCISQGDATHTYTVLHIDYI